MKNKLLTGKTAIVTGGSRGIGLAIARGLVDSGAKVLICSRTSSHIQSALNKLNSDGIKAYGKITDVSKYNHCRQLINYAQKVFRKIDILVNNAGIYGPIGLVEDNNPKLWENTIKINLLGMVYLSQLVIPIMKIQKHGKIINLAGAGIGGVNPLPRFSAYYTSKMAVYGFTECISAELKDFNIQINCILPGAVFTNITRELIKAGPKLVGLTMYQNAQIQEKSKEYSPIRAAQLVAFLSSIKADGITGRILSAKWDSIENLSKLSAADKNLYTLRRIDDSLFYEKKP